jgi:hypothetical protein
MFQFGIGSKGTRSLRKRGQHQVYSAISMQLFKQEIENRVRDRTKSSVEL